MREGGAVVVANYTRRVRVIRKLDPFAIRTFSMRQSDLCRFWGVAFFATVILAGIGDGVVAQPPLISDDFESYPAGEGIHGQGGWSARGPGTDHGVTVVADSSTGGGGENGRVVRYHDAGGSESTQRLMQSFPKQSIYIVETTFLLRINELDGDVGMHNVVLRGPGGTASRLRFGPDGLTLLGARDEAGGKRKLGRRIIRPVREGDWYRVTVWADPQTQQTWAKATNLDRDDADQRGEAEPVYFFSDISELTRWSVERASMTPVDVSLDDVEVRAVPDPDRDPPVEVSGLVMPGEPVIAKGTRARMVDGRIEGEKAVMVEAGSVAWEVSNLEGHHYAEFWLSPVAWNPVRGDEVVVATFTVGGDELVLRKPADRSELRLERAGQVLQVYPTYAWDHQDWLAGTGSRGVRGLIRRTIPWHHVHVAVGGDRVSLTVDGFQAMPGETATVSGSLSRVALHGEPGTAYAAVAATTGTPMAASELRMRYLTLFLDEPQIMRNLITVPYLTRPPSIDGQVDHDEWSGAAQIVGFRKVGSGAALTEEVVGYIGYDDERVYVAMVTPTDEAVSGKRKAGQRDLPLWEEEAMAMTLSPPFVSGEEPRQAAQLIGDPAGNQTDRMELPKRDLEWDAKWDWRARKADGGWEGELAATFADLSFPTPNSKDLWGFNLVNPKAGATWSHVEDAVNLGNLRFQREPTLVRPLSLTFDEGAATLEVDLTRGKDSHYLVVGMQLFGEGDREPRKTVTENLTLDQGEQQRVKLTLDLDEQEKGRVALFVRQGHLYLYFHSVDFPAVAGR